MALPDLTTDEGLKEALGKLDPDFQGLMERKEIPARLQGQLSNLGVKSVSRYSVIGENAGDIRTFAVDHAGQDRNRDVVSIAGLVDLWNACKTRMTARHQAEADASNQRLPAPVQRGELQELKQRFEVIYYQLDDKVTPSGGTMEQLFEQVEAGEWKNMSLVQFMSRDDQDAEPLAATIDKGGAVKIKRGYGESKPPRNPEEFRQKMKLIAHSYIMTSMKFPNKAPLKTISPNIFNKYIDYLLGEHCYGLKARNERDEAVSAPSLELVLSYDFQVRKKMVKMMNEGMDLVAALDGAMQDGTVKERYFLTPAAMNAAASRAPSPPKGNLRLRSRSPRRRGRSQDRPRTPDQGPRTKGKRGGGKGKGRGKGKLASRTPDGRAICFAWNNRDQRCRFNCGRLHVCQYCFGSHPAHACVNQRSEAPKDTAGTGGGGEGASK